MEPAYVLAPEGFHEFEYVPTSRGVMIFLLKLLFLLASLRRNDFQASLVPLRLPFQLQQFNRPMRVLLPLPLRFLVDLRRDCRKSTQLIMPVLLQLQLKRTTWFSLTAMSLKLSVLDQCLIYEVITLSHLVPCWSPFL
jgi:hypothetical protein